MKKTKITILTTVLLFALTGCGTTNEDQTESTTATAQRTEQISIDITEAASTEKITTEVIKVDAFEDDPELKKFELTDKKGNTIPCYGMYFDNYDGFMNALMKNLQRTSAIYTPSSVYNGKKKISAIHFRGHNETDPSYIDVDITVDNEHVIKNMHVKKTEAKEWIVESNIDGQWAPERPEPEEGPDGE